MRHLTLEEIARLVDEAPEPGEALHLAECPACHEELDAMRGQTESLARLAGALPPEPSPRAWAALEERLAEEGLLRRPARPAARSHAFLRIAASLALVALGGAGGLALWKQAGRGTQAAPPAPVAARETPAEAVRPDPPAGPLPAEAGTEAPAPLESAPPARLASFGAEPERRAERRAAPKRASEETLRELREAQAAYLRGLAEYAELAEAENPNPIARLAALEGLVRATRSALERSPGDPVINGYYLAAVGQRDAMIRQLAQASQETWY
jgi:hypothetical protein